LREITEIEALTGGIKRTEEALEAFAEVLGADEERLGGICVELDEADGGAGRERGEEVFVEGGGEVVAAVEIKHERRILRGREEVDSRQLNVERAERRVGVVDRFAR